MGGRWNPKGVPVVYTASSLALAVLELLVHVDIDLLPDDLLSCAIDVPKNLPIERLEISTLPSGWRNHPAPEALQDIGVNWVHRQASAVLAVSSAMIPNEYSFLLNPAHPDFSQIRWQAPTPFYLDPRLRL